MSSQARITASVENPLCGRLQQKFIGRGVSQAISNTGRVQTGAKANRQSRVSAAENSAIARNANPFESSAQYTPAKARQRENAKTRSFSAAEVRSTAEDARRSATRRVAAFEKTTPFESGAFAEAYTRAAEIRARAYDGAEAKISAARIAKQNEKVKAAPLFSREGIKQLFAGRSDEVSVEGVHVSKGLVISIVLFAVVIMMIVFSFSQINEFKSEINGLSEQKQTLQTEIDKLSLDIDLKNDVRVIEKAATEDIGMVKSNQVESRYINVSEGERVEVINDESTEDNTDWGIFTTMMSAVSGNWDKLLEYID